MTTYIQGKDGKFAGSIGPGKIAPTSPDIPTLRSAVTPAESSAPTVDAVHEAYMRHTRINRDYGTGIREPDARGALSDARPEDRPHLVRNHRDDDVWFCATENEAKDLAARLTESDSYLSGWIAWE